MVLQASVSIRTTRWQSLWGTQTTRWLLSWHSTGRSSWRSMELMCKASQRNEAARSMLLVLAIACCGRPFASALAVKLAGHIFSFSVGCTHSQSTGYSKKQSRTLIQVGSQSTGSGHVFKDHQGMSTLRCANGCIRMQIQRHASIFRYSTEKSYIGTSSTWC